MAKKKKIDPGETFRWQEYKYSPIISEKYPNLKSLTIRMTFYDDSGNRQVGKVRTWNVPLTAKAFFYKKCPMWECVNGGFDLSQAVDSAIQSGEDHTKGYLICWGWQDKERVGQFHCLTELHYEISVEHKQDSEAKGETL